jgi:peptidoglycan/LPS O-acetylase OafA/YrhL
VNPVSPYPAVAALLLAMITAFCFARQFGAPTAKGRYASIDGLRGYLAFFVFLHHASVWYFYLRTGQWKTPPSNLYTHFGQSSVTCFFMITGFLFWSKLIDWKEKPIDWTRLFISRVLRLTPLYIFAIALMFVLVAYISNFALNESPLKLIEEIMCWLSFTILGTPDLNGVQNTLAILPVTWSLRYEWLFYLSLPVFGLFLRMRPSWLYVALSFFAIFGAILFWKPSPAVISAFVGGIAAAFLVRSKLICSLAILKVSTFIALVCIVFVVFGFRSAYSQVPLVLLSLAFAIIACGNNLFGLLTNSISRTLGEISYSIYLLHSIVLFVTFKFIVGLENAASLSSVEHWLVIAGCSPFLISLCFATFRFIEAPAMRKVPYVTEWVQMRLIRLSSRPGSTR